jgi:hypothetical protein
MSIAYNILSKGKEVRRQQMIKFGENDSIKLAFCFIVRKELHVYDSTIAMCVCVPVYMCVHVFVLLTL